MYLLHASTVMLLLKCKGDEWNFLASALTFPLSLQSEAVDKLTFRSAAKNLTHGLDLLSLNLLTYNQQHYNPDEFINDQAYTA